ncbi:MAG: heavy-metal-associated domain-containing protein [bacterium]
MNYSIKITGMHCSGCKNLIQMSLEDEQLQAVVVDNEKDFATFKTDDSEDAVKSTLNKVFTELGKYSYTDLKAI